MMANTQALRIRGEVGRHLERLSTGLKINRGGDDPSGLGIARNTQAQVRGTNTAIHNVEEGIHVYNMRDALLAEDQEMALRIRDLAVRSANEATLTTRDRQAMQQEVAKLMEQINQAAYASPKVGGTARLLYAPSKLDVIWVLDATASMIPAATALRDASAQMFNEFQANGLDVRMNVTPFSFNIFQTWGANSVSWNFQQDAVSFQNDVDEIVGMINAGTGGFENGLLAINNTIDNGQLGGAFRTGSDVTRAIILITDEDSDDFGFTGPFGLPIDPNANAAPAAVAARAALTAKLQANNIILHAVGMERYFAAPAQWPAPDEDYAEVARNTGGSVITLEDAGTSWTTQITSALKASYADWDAEFQVGPDSGMNQSGHSMTFTFSSVTTDSMGLASANVATTAGAQATIDIANNALEWLSNERAETGWAVERLKHIANDLAAMSIGNSAFKSGLEDALMDQEIVDMTIQNMLSNTVAAAQAQANATVESASRFISVVSNSENLDQFSGIFTVQQTL